MLLALALTALAAPDAPDAPASDTIAVTAPSPAPVPDARVWIGVGIGGGVGADVTPGGGGGAGFELGARLGREPRRALAVAVRVRELMMDGPLRNIGNIGVLVQYPTGTGPHLNVGFSHSHESLFADYIAHPVAVTAGIHDTLTHRSGFEIGGGWDFPPPFPKHPVTAGLRPTAALSAFVFPDAGGPHAYVVAEVGARFGLDAVFGGGQRDR